MSIIPVICYNYLRSCDESRKREEEERRKRMEAWKREEEERRKRREREEEEIKKVKERVCVCPLCGAEMRLTCRTSYGHGESYESYNLECTSCFIASQTIGTYAGYNVAQVVNELKDKIDSLRFK